MNNFKNPLSDDIYKERIIPREEDIRGPFFRDQTAIIHSFPFRRLKHKAQVFFSPNNDHVCTRIEHSLHVATIAKEIARGLSLNEEMAYAIGIGHDLGHAPFGHAGESVLADRTKANGGFIHEIHGLRVVDILGNHGNSLNLTYGVRDGIICHCGEAFDREIEPRHDHKDLSTIKERNIYPCSYEGCIARMSDRIAYLGRDLEDSIYGGYIKIEDIPPSIKDELGENNGEIIDTLVIDVINTSQKTGKISLSEKRYKVLMELHGFSKKNIYQHSAIERYKLYCVQIIETLFDHLANLMEINGWHFEKYYKSQIPLDKRFGKFLYNMKNIDQYNKEPNIIIVKDYIAGMTDGYALRCMREISLPDELIFNT